MPLNPEQIEALISMPTHQITLRTVVAKGIPLRALAESIVDGTLAAVGEHTAELLLLPTMQQLILLVTVERMTTGQAKLYEAVEELTEAVQALRADLQRTRESKPAPQASKSTAASPRKP